jgi:Tfp pilus assembly protein PilO
MKVDMQLMRKLTPSVQRSISITLGALTVCLLVFCLAILPTQKQIRLTLEKNDSLNETLNQMLQDVASVETLKKQSATSTSQLDALSAQGVIEPLLGSFAMRGKALLDPLALESGFSIDNVKECPQIPLQLPKPPPKQVYVRQPVEFSGQGSYTQIVSFIAKAEAAHPLLTLASLLILSQQQTPETHKASITFEWPAKGEKPAPAGSLSNK